jgi:hypothetical protein
MKKEFCGRLYLFSVKGAKRRRRRRRYMWRAGVWRDVARRNSFSAKSAFRRKKEKSGKAYEKMCAYAKKWRTPCNADNNKGDNNIAWRQALANVGIWRKAAMSGGDYNVSRRL